MPSLRAQACVAACGALALLALATVGTSAASAAQTHAYSTSFGALGSGAGQLSLSEPDTEGGRGSGLAINESTGDLYVADTGNHRIDQFTAAGTFVRAWGWGVRTGAAELQVCSELTGCQAGISGQSPGQFKLPTFVAVDNSCAEHEPPLTESTVPSCADFDPSAGDVYVADTGDIPQDSGEQLVTKFDSGGSLIESWGTAGQINGEAATDGPFSRFKGIAIGSAGALWVEAAQLNNKNGSFLFEFDPSGAFIKDQNEFLVFQSAGLAIDPAGNFYYIGEGVEQLDPAGSRVGRLFSKFGLTGIARDPFRGDLYASERTAINDISSQCKPSQVGCSPTQTFGAPQLDEAAGLALAPDGALYAANTGAGQIAVFKVSLEATIAPPTGVHATSATLNGAIDPKAGGNVTRCFFRTGKTTSYGHNIPCLNEAGHEVSASEPITGPTEVHAVLEGLEGGSSYHVALRAFNAAEEEVTSEDELLETLVIPVIGEGKTTEITAGSATLEATVNPKGLPVTSCQIEWGTSTAYGTTIPCEPASLPAGSSPAPIAAHLAGLSPDTTYHWRVIAVDANGTATGADNTFVFSTESPGSPAGSCSNESLRQVNGSLELPDCRAYELVDPPQKNGALLAPVIFGLEPSIAGDGSRLIASSLQCFGGSQSCTGDRASKGPPFAFERSASGWVTRSLAPSASELEVNSVWAYNADTGDVLYSSPIDSEVTDEFYARRPSGAMEPIGPIGESEGFVRIAASPVLATADVSGVIYESNRPLWSFDPGGPMENPSLYEYAGVANPHPRLLGVSGGEGSTDLISACGSTLASSQGSARNEAVSADGQTVYFSPLGCSTGTGDNAGVEVPAQQVYARVDNDSAQARTVPISARATSGCSGSCTTSKVEPSRFEGASEDGSSAYITSTQQLLDGATQGSSNLYLYADTQQPLAGAHLVDVSAGDTSGLGPDVQGVMAVSADGSHVYFVAGGVLTGVNGEGEAPIEGGDNLYVFQRDVAHPSGSTTFIATLPGTANTANGERAETLQWTSHGFPAANVTPDGRVLLFTSHGALTADVTRPAGPAQVYRYDSGQERLLRVSIGAGGFNDNGNEGSGEARIVPPSAGESQARRDPSMSADGSRVFFQSPVGLTPGALDDVPLNGRGESEDLAQNVYEWVAQGTGECRQAAGCVSLISDGEDISEGNNGGGHTTSSSVELLGTDVSGENIFFSTADPLVSTDTDTGYDIYDARARAGFAAPSEPVPCQGDACKGPATGPGPLGSPATPAFDGPAEGPAHPQKPKKRHKKKHGKQKKKHGRKKHASATG